jgi:hypothetical protein
MLLGAIVVGLVLTNTASAGLRGNWPVTVDPVGRTAIGSMAQARAAIGGQYIGCWVQIVGLETVTDPTNPNDPGDATLQGGCSALSATNVPVSCTFPTVRADALQDIPYISSPDALVWFGWDANGTCTFLETFVYASLLPKAH